MFGSVDYQLYMPLLFRPLCRLSTVQSADQIVVMQNGRIAEKGTHNELLSRGGCYSQLMSSQEMILGASV
jgi:ABC-type microcin C transport system duplicated ATPase subunit YejF